MNKGWVQYPAFFYTQKITFEAPKFTPDNKKKQTDT